MSTFALYSRPYLDTCSQEYKNIIITNKLPLGPLQSFVRRVKFVPLSQFKTYVACDCSYGFAPLSDCRNKCQYLETDYLDELLGFLMENGYVINTEVTNMLHIGDVRVKTDVSYKLICYVTYK